MKGGDSFPVSVTLTSSRFEELKKEIKVKIDSTTSSSIETPTPHIDAPTEENPKTAVVELPRDDVDRIAKKLLEEFEGLNPRVRKVTKAELDKLKPIFDEVKTEVKTMLSGETDQTLQIFKYSALRDSILIHIIGIENFVNRCVSVDSKNKGGFTNKDKVKDYERIVKYIPDVMKNLEKNRGTWMKEEHIQTLESFGLKHIWNDIILHPDDREKNVELNNLGNNFNLYDSSVDTPIKDSFEKYVMDFLKVNSWASIFSYNFKTRDAFISVFRKFYAVHKEIWREREREREREKEVREEELRVLNVKNTNNWPGADPSKIDGGAFPEEIVSNFSQQSEHPPPLGYKETKIIGVAIVYICTFFVLLDSYRRLAYQIDRIVSANETYLQVFPEDQIHKNYTYILSSILSFFYVMHQVVSGGILQWVNALNSNTSYETIKNIVQAAADETGRKTLESCQDGYFGCINGFFTGVTRDFMQNELATQATTNIKMAVESQFNALQAEARSIVYEYNLATSNIVTGINVLSFSTLVLMNTFFPESYTREMVMAGAGSLQGAYLSSSIWMRVGFTGAQVMILLQPLPNLLMNSGQREGPGQGQIQNGPADEDIQEVERLRIEGERQKLLQILGSEDRRINERRDIRDEIARIREEKEAYDLLNELNGPLKARRGGSHSGGSRKKQSHKNYRKKSHKKKYTRNSKQTRKQRRRKTKSKK